MQSPPKGGDSVPGRHAAVHHAHAGIADVTPRSAALLLLLQRALLRFVAVPPERLQLAPPDAQLIEVHVHQLSIGPARELGDQQDHPADGGRGYSSRLEKP